MTTKKNTITNPRHIQIRGRRDDEKQMNAKLYLFGTLKKA